MLKRLRAKIACFEIGLAVVRKMLGALIVFDSDAVSTR